MLSIGDLFLNLRLDTKSLNGQINDAARGAQKSANRAFSSIGKIAASALSTAAIVSFGKSCLDLGSDLAEVQNVVDVTFPNMNAQVNDFAKNAINKFGLSETVAKRMAGTYGAMAKAFGYSEAAAYDMATTLTGLAGDVASFYNLDPTEAYTKLKSVFSGETETLKDLGIVMTQNSLDQYALANGFGKTTSAMSEQEKVSLRLAFVTNQLSAASGDFARTSDSWANKTRVLNLNFQSLKATLGQGFIALLSPLVSLLNTVVVKLQQAAQWFTAFVSLLSANKKTSSSLGSVSQSVSDISSGAAALSDNVAGVGSAAKKAAKDMGALAGFDEINNLSSSDSSDTSGGGAGAPIGDTDLDLTGMNEMPEIDTSGMENSINKAKEMWQSFTDFFKKNGTVIVSVCAGIGAGFLAFQVLNNIGKYIGPISKLTGWFKNFFLAIKNFGLVKTIFAGLSTVLGGVSAPVIAITVAIAAVTAALVYLYQTSDSFRNLVNEAIGNIGSVLTNIWTSVLQPLFGFLLDVFNTVIVPLAEFIAKVVVKAVEAVATIALSFWNNILAPIANFMVDILGIALQGVIDIWNGWKPAIDELFKALNWIWDEMLSPLVDWIVDTFTKGFEDWGTFIQELIPSVEEIFQGLVDFFVGIFTGDTEKAWAGIQEIFQGFDDFLKNIFEKDWSESFGFFGTILNTFLDTASEIWDSVKGIFEGAIDFVDCVFKGDWEGAWEAVKDVFGSVWDGLKAIFKAPINACIDLLNMFIEKINSFHVDIPDWIPSWLGGGQSFGFSIPTIPHLAEGGYVKANTPQLAMIGDNKRYGEIVTPENKMYDTVMSALKNYGAQNNGNMDMQVIVSVMYEILEAIRNLRLTVDSDSLNDDGHKRDQERALRTGKLVLE